MNPTPGTGGSNGGANGNTGTAPTGGAGGANSGGGGGGGGYSLGFGVGGAGGSGTVVIRYPNTYADPVSVTGSPTVTNTGGYKIYQWKTVGTWSITF
jgi:hypothetical protein